MEIVASKSITALGSLTQQEFPPFSNLQFKLPRILNLVHPV